MTNLAGRAHQLLLLLWGLLLTQVSQGQDLIQVRDSFGIRAYVVDITPQEIRYRFTDDTLASVRAVSVSRVRFVQFATGPLQPFPLPNGELPAFLQRPASVVALAPRSIAVVPAVAARPAVAPASTVYRPMRAPGLHHLWRLEVGLVTTMGSAPASFGLRGAAEWPVYATKDLTRSLHLGMLLLAHRPPQPTVDSLRPAALLAESHVLPFLTASWRQRLGSGVYVVGRLGLSPGRVVRTPAYDPFERKLRYDNLFFGGGSQLLGLSVAVPFSRIRPCFGLVLGAELYRSAFTADAARYRQHMRQLSLGFTF
ncbi:hypothetical protein [Hymenobacter elongatus]|uniref:Uncharacterized protein n=1 Tax=Hymenobacter elongatus TaxID=877208 RepID=A0A4Z0PK21_9BACT|nr:hypothetical protein [Hymenobacter elongatus]TGE15409.1 hypothetical protein E5J99_12460 [Hymenobacter elongatus]